MNLADTDGMTPLMHAVKTNDVNVVLRLMHKSGEFPKGPFIKEVCTEGGWQTYLVQLGAVLKLSKGA